MFPIPNTIETLIKIVLDSSSLVIISLIIARRNEMLITSEAAGMNAYSLATKLAS